MTSLLFVCTPRGTLYTREVYLDLRKLFIERMHLPDSFNFHEFLVESAEEEFSKVIGTTPFQWVRLCVPLLFLFIFIIIIIFIILLLFGGLGILLKH